MRLLVLQKKIYLLASLSYPVFLFSVRKGYRCDTIFQLVKSCKFFSIGVQISCKAGYDCALALTAVAGNINWGSLKGEYFVNFALCCAILVPSWRFRPVFSSTRFSETRWCFLFTNSSFGIWTHGMLVTFLSKKTWK